METFDPIRAPDDNTEYVGFWARSWAVSIDSFIILGAVIVLTAIVVQFLPAKKELGEKFAMMIMDFMSQKLQGMQDMPMGSQDEMKDTLSQMLGKLDASFTSIMLPLQIIFSAFYYAIPESSRMQGSLGKYLMGMKIVGLNGERIGFLRAMARNLFKIVPQYLNFFLSIIVYLTIPFDKRKRGIHDMICKTYVIYRNDR